MNQPKLNISLLGGMTIHQNGQLITGFASRKVAALLAYLVCNPRLHQRETLATLLWPANDQGRALANLSVGLTSLRNQLGDLILADRHTVGFDTEVEVVVDSAEFEQALSLARPTLQHDKLSRSNIAALAKAVALYQGDFLAGFNVRGAPEFEAWALLEQERLRQLLLNALTALIAASQQRRQLEKGIQYAQQLLAIDPLQESVHQQLMTLYLQNDQRAAALAQYDLCVQILDAELGVEPAPNLVTLYEQIRDDELPLAALALTPLDPTTLHNLPAPPNVFIGRQTEMGLIDDWLSRPRSPLLTIIGPGGTGKTRLAQESARAHLGEFSNGIYAISLVSHPDFDGLLTALANAIDLPPMDNSDLEEALGNHLRSKEMLLLLDNVEHLLTERTQQFLSHLIASAPGIKFLATSRERLNLQAETLLTLRGLPYPPLPASAETPTLTDSPAIQLFMNRARRLQATLALAGNETAVVQLCQLVDGLPLALELAATWVRALSIPEIVAEIQRNLDILTTTQPDIPARHRSIQAVFDYSWQLLSAEEQAVFARLSIFRGGFTRQAGQHIARATLPQLSHLVDKSLLMLDQHQAAHPRYRRHPLLLQYAAAKRQQLPDNSAVWETYARYFGQLMQQQELNLFGGTPEASLNLIRTESENIKRAWRWAVTHADAAIINQMGDSIMQSFDLLGLYQDALNMAMAAADALAPLTAQDAETAVALGRVLGLAGAFHFRLGNYEQARNDCQQSCQILEPHQPHIAYAHTLVYAGAAAFGLSDFDAVRAHWQAANDAYQAVGSIWGQTVVTNNLSEVELLLGDSDAASRYAKQGYSLAQSMGDFELMGTPLQVLSTLAMAADDLEMAYRYGEEAVACHRQTGHQAHLANALANLGRVAMARHQLPEARQYLEESVAILQKSGAHLYLMTHLIELGRVRMAQGEMADAEAALNHVLMEAIPTQSQEIAMRALSHLADLYSRNGRLESAVVLAEFVLAQESAVAEVKTLAATVSEKGAATLPAASFKAAQKQATTLSLSKLAKSLSYP